jgi:spore maturation protein CgeB
MRFVLFTHSLTSDWNHGNAHFLRGILRELQRAGHQTLACEPADGWSRRQLMSELDGGQALSLFTNAFPDIPIISYGPDPDLDQLLSGADVVIVHEWTDPALVKAIGRRRRSGGRFTLFFHDTHHRAVSAESQMAALELGDYDAVLAFGAVLSETYRARGWGRRVFTWHEAADIAWFGPHPEIAADRDLVFIGNWGDEERSDELRRFLIGPSARLKLATTVHGVRYPAAAIAELNEAGVAYDGYLPNLAVPRAFARHRVTIHVPRGPYVRQLRGIPTIRVFEALACGIALICAPWSDSEGLFRPDRDFLLAKDGDDVERKLRLLMADEAMRAAVAASGREQILARHSCRHRVQELLAILAGLEAARESQEAAA